RPLSQSAHDPSGSLRFPQLLSLLFVPSASLPALPSPPSMFLCSPGLRSPLRVLST
ncbi:Hypothetical predicted protein, partial [Marmota monax]